MLILHLTYHSNLYIQNNGLAVQGEIGTPEMWTLLGVLIATYSIGTKHYQSTPLARS